MTGTIKSYLEDKQFGFIKGDDNKDYFFHRSSVNNKDSIVDGAVVSFETKATPKGYSAVKVKIEKLSEMKYIVPDDIYTSKDRKVKGWETVEESLWTIHSSTKDSPDMARQEIIRRAASIGANAVVNLQYNKTTGSTVSDSGKGTYYYSIHNFSAIPVNIGKKSGAGKYTKGDLTRINRLAEKKKAELVVETDSSKKAVSTFYIIALLIAIIGGTIGGTMGNTTVVGLSVAILIGGLLFVRSEDYDWWLERR